MYGCMAEAAQRDIELDGLLEKAHRIAIEFRLSSIEAQEDQSKIPLLVSSFQLLERRRKQLLTNPHLQGQSQCCSLNNSRCPILADI